MKIIIAIELNLIVYAVWQILTVNLCPVVSIVYILLHRVRPIYSGFII